MVRPLPVSLDWLRVEIWRRCPRTVPRAFTAASVLAATLAVPAMLLLVVSPLLIHPWTLGDHNWDQMNTQREVVVKTIARFHQFPFWDPYECGGHVAWGSLESAPILVSPWLPAYLLAPLPVAIRIEIIVSAIWSAVGCWLLASRFTESRVLRALLVIVTVVNSRWGLQIAVGHTWHLLYGFLPWILYLFDRAIDPEVDARRARRDIVLAAVCLAVMVYGDAIYPVPHTAFAVTVYAGVMAYSRRSTRPLRALVAFGTFALGLCAVKLLPLYEEMTRFPRLIKSEEAIWPQDLPKIFTWRLTDIWATTSFTDGMWHEWGFYLGWPVLVLLIMGVTTARGPRERALRWVGLLMLAFVIGGFHQLAPWRLMHVLPVFKSQHVPSRWAYPAVLILTCVAVSSAEQWLLRAGDRRAFFEALLGFGAAIIALDLGVVARAPIARSFTTPVPALEDQTPPFHMVRRLPPRPDYRPALWDIATLPGVIENVGTMDCDTHNVLHITHRDEDGRMPGLGAWPDDDPEYRGETYVAEATGTATITSWTPNEVEVRVEGARAGDHVVLNQNWDPGWSADSVRAIAYRDAVAAVLAAPSQTVRFRYRPRSFEWALAICGMTIASIGIFLARGRRTAQ
jgi:hypothetical protein